MTVLLLLAVLLAPLPEKLTTLLVDSERSNPGGCGCRGRGEIAPRGGSGQRAVMPSAHPRTPAHLDVFVGYVDKRLHSSGDAHGRGGRLKPADAFTRHAQAVVSGQAPAEAWKVARYRQALADGVTVKGRCKQTRYCLRCDPTNEARDGTKPLYVGMCAANPEVPMHSVLWVQGVGLLRVRDRGGAVKLGRYVRRGETANVDVFVGRRCPGGCNNGTRHGVAYAVLGK